MKILIVRSGLLGDTLVALPAIWHLKELYPDAMFIYLYDDHDHKVKAPDVLGGSGLLDEMMPLIKYGGLGLRIKNLLGVWIKLLGHRIDRAYILEEDHWTSKKRFLLGAALVKQIICPSGQTAAMPRDSHGRLMVLDSIADNLLAGIGGPPGTLPGKGCGHFELPLSHSERNFSKVWLQKMGILSTESKLFAVGAWSNMPLKRWPMQRWIDVIHYLHQAYGLVPVFLGGTEEQPFLNEICAFSKMGVVGAGLLSVRESAAVLSHTQFYLGNDTGIMHLAVAVGKPCVALFSARESPGRWYPYGKNHQVLQMRPRCEGCMLTECIEHNMQCIMDITVPQVISACETVIGKLEI